MHYCDLRHLGHLDEAARKRSEVKYGGISRAESMEMLRKAVAGPSPVARYDAEDEEDIRYRVTGVPKRTLPPREDDDEAWDVLARFGNELEADEFMRRIRTTTRYRKDRDWTPQRGFIPPSP